MKILFVWPSARFSTFDVANGLRRAFDDLCVPVEDFRLYQRLEVISRGMHSLKPDDTVIDMNTACLMACEALPYKAIVGRTKWVLIISGMGVHPNALVALRALGVKIAIWFTEGPYFTDNEHELHLVQFADLCIVNERICVGQFQEILDKTTKGMAIYLPHAYDPHSHVPKEQMRDIDLLLVGTGFAERQQLLENMNFDGINFHLGGLWNGITKGHRLEQYYKYPCIDNKELVDLYHKTKIGFNPHRYSETAQSCNPRVFELAATGTFQISDYRQEIKDIFDDSISMYEPGIAWQAEALIRRALHDDEFRNNCINSAFKKVENHTFAERVKKIVELIEKW